jgi:hypothetical protein
MDALTLIGTHWLSNHKTGTFHLEPADWVKSGRAACGEDVRNPGWIVISPTPSAKLCEHCLRRLRA